MPPSRLSKGFDLESVLEDLEADLREVLEQVTDQHDWRVSAQARDPAKPAFDRIKPIIPAKDFELSKRFYGEIFEARWETDQFCEFSVGTSEFLLQDVAGPELRPACVHEVTAIDAQSTWRFLSKVVAKYAGTSVLPPKVEPWGTVVYLHGPSGESWCVTEPRGRFEGAIEPFS